MNKEVRSSKSEISNLVKFSTAGAAIIGLVIPASNAVAGGTSTLVKNGFESSLSGEESVSNRISINSLAGVTINTEFKCNGLDQTYSYNVQNNSPSEIVFGAIFDGRIIDIEQSSRIPAGSSDLFSGWAGNYAPGTNVASVAYIDGQPESEVVLVAPDCSPTPTPTETTPTPTETTPTPTETTPTPTETTPTPTETTPNPTPVTVSGAAKAIKKSSKIKGDFSPDSPSVNYSGNIQKFKDGNWINVKPFITKGDTDTVVADLPKGKYRMVVDSTSLNTALTTNSVKLKK